MTHILCTLVLGYFLLHLAWAYVQRYPERVIVLAEQAERYEEKLHLESSILTRIAKAKEILVDPGFKCERSKFKTKMFIALWDSVEKRIEIVTLNKSFGKIKTDQEIEIKEIEILGPNTFIIPGYELLAVKIPYRIRETGVIKEIIYTPYSQVLDCEELQTKGELYLDSIIDEAYRYLEKKNVLSRSFPQKEVTEIVPKDLIKNLIVTEHLPFDTSKTVKERVNTVFAILGANKETAYNYTVSEKNAVGVAQFIRSTYDKIVKLYPEAKLDPNFHSGTRNHISAIVAMILLCDVNAALVKKSNLDISLARLYNGGTGKIMPETVKYLEKYKLVKKIIG